MAESRHRWHTTTFNESNRVENQVNFFREKIDRSLTWLVVHSSIARLSVTKKIVTAYLLVACFSLIAIGYAMISLHQQTTASTDLVHNDTKSVTLARELQDNLISQEKMGKQYLVVEKQDYLNLLLEKYANFPLLWSDFLPLLADNQRAEVTPLYKEYRQEGGKFRELLQTEKSIKALDNRFKQKFLPTHRALFISLIEFQKSQQLNIDAALEGLARDSARSFQITLLLMLLGFFLATPVALSVILSIHHSLRHLTRATLQIAEGNYDVEINLSSHDEFGQLAREFLEMSRKLQEFEVANLDASPLTHLPGNLVIQRRVEGFLRDKIPFAHAFVDLDHFKAYNDRYGYQNGSDIISDVAEIIEKIIADEGNEDDFVGHIGGDDYIFLTSTEKVENLAARVIEEFDKMIPEKYSDEDRQAGFFVCQDRFGVERQFPLMTISIAIICSDTSNYNSAIAISHECAKMKEHLKRLPGSNYLVDRRQGKT